MIENAVERELNANYCCSISRFIHICRGICKCDHTNAFFGIANENRKNEEEAAAKKNQKIHKIHICCICHTNFFFFSVFFLMCACTLFMGFYFDTFLALNFEFFDSLRCSILRSRHTKMPVMRHGLCHSTVIYRLVSMRDDNNEEISGFDMLEYHNDSFNCHCRSAHVRIS